MPRPAEAYYTPVSTSLEPSLRHLNDTQNGDPRNPAAVTRIFPSQNHTFQCSKQGGSTVTVPTVQWAP